MVSNQEKNFLAKTEICEMAPRPTPLTFSVLQKVYGEDGPVQNIYKKYNIHYNDTDFLTLVGNELFVDKQKEVQSLLPSYQYVSAQDEQPKMVTFSGLFRTIKNIIALQTIKPSNPQKIFQKLKTEYEQTEYPQEMNSFLPHFFQVYQTIFEINLLCGVSIKKLNFTLKKEKISIAEIIQNTTLFLDSKIDFVLQFQSNLIGNSIEISDESPFFRSDFIQNKINPKTNAWWTSLPEWKRKLYKPIITESILYTRLREYSRWLIVKKINQLRTIVTTVADTLEFSSNKNIYFCTIDEILNGAPQEGVAIKRKREYTEASSATFNNKPLEKKLSGISAGVGQGILLDLSLLQKPEYKDVNIILFAELLTPDLTVYLERINGIVSTQGSFLSHIAIVARERNIPVIVNFIPSEEIKIGDLIQIDGTNGKILKYKDENF